jgi:hypothetical protein
MDGPAMDNSGAHAPRPRRPAIVILALIAAGYGLTLRVFYPGVWTYDARYVYGAIAEGRAGDWQSPVMTWLWALIDPVSPGAGSMFLLIASLYWLAFAVISLSIRRQAPIVAIVVPLLALAPPAFLFVGVIWRDVFLAAVWLLAAALAFSAVGARLAARWPVQALALGLVALGVLLRPNALLAGPVLAAYVPWPSRFAWKRTAILYLPAAIAFYALIQVIYYGALDAMRQNPLHQIFVFDLAGITHFSKQNAFPVTWTPAQMSQLTSTCYDPRIWDVYWNREPCRFVMDRLEKQERIFGTPVLARAWRQAILDRPLAYLQHRATYFWTFVAGSNFTIWFQDLGDSTKTIYLDDPAFMTLKAMHDALKPTPLFRVGVWLAACAALCAFAWRRRATAAGAFAIGVCGAAIVYVMTFAAVGIAADFRYGYWAVLAALAGGAVLAAGRRADVATRLRPP